MTRRTARTSIEREKVGLQDLGQRIAGTTDLVRLRKQAAEWVALAGAIRANVATAISASPLSFATDGHKGSATEEGRVWRSAVSRRAPVSSAQPAGVDLLKEVLASSVQAAQDFSANKDLVGSSEGDFRRSVLKVLDQIAYVSQTLDSIAPGGTG